MATSVLGFTVSLYSIQTLYEHLKQGALFAGSTFVIPTTNFFCSLATHHYIHMITGYVRV